MISTGAMVQIGKCYGNRMVDLNASNKKLKVRAVNLVVDLSKYIGSEAVEALHATKWNIKSSILMLSSGAPMDAAAAIAQVSAAKGHLREAMG